jgi:hypothetical protein
MYPDTELGHQLSSTLNITSRLRKDQLTGEPKRHWELDEQGQPTQQIIENRRRAEFITPIVIAQQVRETIEE